MANPAHQVVSIRGNPKWIKPREYSAHNACGLSKSTDPAIRYLEWEVDLHGDFIRGTPRVGIVGG